MPLISESSFEKVDGSYPQDLLADSALVAEGLDFFLPSPGVGDTMAVLLTMEQ